MAITQDYILKGGLKSSDDAANSRLKMMDQERIQGQENASKEGIAGRENDAKLRQLLAGKQFDSSENERQRQADLADVQSLRRTVGKDANISAGHVKIDPRVIEPGQNLTPGQRAADTAFGKDYSDYVAGGGSTAVQKNLDALERGGADIKNTTKFQQMTGGLPDALRSFLTPEAVAREENIKGAIQNTLKQTLGAQFTEKEGERIFRNAYNPRLSPQENQQRVNAAIQQLKSQAAQKAQSAQQFENTGSLVGLGAAGKVAPRDYKGPSLGGKTSSAAPQQAPQGATGLEHLSDEDLAAMAKKLGL